MKQPNLKTLKQFLKNVAPKEPDPKVTTQHSPASPEIHAPVLLTSSYYYMQSQRVWQIALYSLPLDLIFILVALNDSTPPNTALVSLTEIIMMILSLLCTLVLIRHKAIELLLRIDKLQGKVAKVSGFKALLVIGLFALFFFIEAVLKFGQLSIFAIVAALFVAVIAVRSMKATLTEQRLARLKLEQNRNLWVEKVNYTIFLFNVVPLLAARALSVCSGVLLWQDAYSDLAFLVFMTGTFGLILYLEPRQDNFQTFCKRCARRTSLALMEEGLCPVCLSQPRK